MTQEIKTYEIDASGKTLGRIASEAAKALMGKKDSSYTPHIRTNAKVTVINVAKMKMMSDKKRAQTKHTRYSGYPGGLTVHSNADIEQKKGLEGILRLAVSRMLPRNTMHTARMKNLSISK